MSNASSLLSAEVIINIKSGRSLSSDDVLPTSENIEEFYPSDETINEVASKLKGLGFEVSSNGLSITIVGNQELFEKVFDAGVCMTKTKQGIIINFCKEPVIPSLLKNSVEKVVFSPPVTYHS